MAIVVVLNLLYYSIQFAHYLDYLQLSFFEQLLVFIVIIMVGPFFIATGLLLIIICTEFIYYIFSFRFKNNYSKTNFTRITGLKFKPYAVLPKNKNFFIETYSEKHILRKTKLPIIDMNDYDFTNVCIRNCDFTNDTILPNDTEFFQKIKNKSLINCILPVGDYSIYNFKGVELNDVVFPEDSTIPLQYGFFRNLKNYKNPRVKLPKSFKDTCHLYDFSKTKLHLYRKIEITDIQKTILINKYKNIDLSFVRKKKGLNKIIKLLSYKFLRIIFN